MIGSSRAGDHELVKCLALNFSGSIGLFSVGMGSPIRVMLGRWRVDIDQLQLVGHSQGVQKMACRICSEPAEEVAPGGDYRDWDCGICGRYRISRTLLAELDATHRSLDVEATRLWIATNRATGDVPMLSTFAAYQHHLLRG